MTEQGNGEHEDRATEAAAANRIINPRLIDPFGLGFTQDDVGFAIPHLREDLPLYVDPFLLWKSDHDEYQELHAAP